MALHGTPVGGGATVTLIRGAELVAAPWKNGGGVTREVAAVPQGAGLDTFVWRVSVADVAQAGPFSRFAGIDRTLVLLSGAGMLLDEADGAQGVKTHALTQALDVARFTGEAHIDARLVDGATRDFNLMVRRDAARGEVDVWRGAGQRTLSEDVVLLYCAQGAVRITPGEARALPLEAGDTLRIDTPSALSCRVEGEGALLAVSIRYAQP
ncbi:HutD/Ves family protein [Paraburkholderia aromaticivorans]|uniref:Histidine utilization protein HutD n=1 Tax=Paraburkholderia aromaticivorans TaxID=2026199 RepID=A0A248VLA2_9BURK|nr:HutD family protein [Paraburkholderia aromaticivorans]ASV99760.1 histidine utilization protein HutD [Paraburkholderia aromaticivorans]